MMTSPQDMTASARLAMRIKHLSTFHVQGREPNFFIFSTARSGTTWLAELLATQGRFKIVNEPFNLRQAVVRDNLKLQTWESLFQSGNRPLIAAYIRSFVNGKDSDVRFKRERPFSRFWHLVTDRIIFKILFAGEDDIDWFRTEFNGHVILLLRHPFPVALSRQELPRLQSFLAPPYSSNFTNEQLEHAGSVIRTGDLFQMAVLDWCLQNAVPFRTRNAAWELLSYEQMVLQPELVIRHLARRFNLPAPQTMRDRVFTASGSTGKSTGDSQSVLRDPQAIRENRSWLIDKWRDRVDPQAQARAWSTVETFGIDYYASGQSLPAHQYLLPDDGRSSAESVQA